MTDVMDINGILVGYAKQYLSYSEMSGLLMQSTGVKLSVDAIRKRLKRRGVPPRRGQTRHSAVEVKRIIERIIPEQPITAGYRYMTDLLRREGIQVRRDDVMKIMRQVDLEGVSFRRRRRLRRRIYSSMGPNHVWHVDGYDKIKPYGFPILGCIDGYSRKIMWLNVGPTNNDPKQVSKYFINCILKRIEAWWSILRRYKMDWWMQFFRDLEAFGLFYRGNRAHILSIRYCFQPLIQNELDKLVDLWNSHYISHSRQASCPHGRPIILNNLPSFTGAVNCIHSITSEDLEWLHSFNVETSVTGCEEFDNFARAQFQRKNWTAATDWTEALHQYTNLLELIM